MLTKVNLFFILLFVINTATKSQTNDKYYIQLADKTGTPYSIANPSQFLSQRAIQRRANQSISINETDLPVNPNYITQIANTGATVFYSIKWFNGVVVQAPTLAILNAINALPFVVSNTVVNIQRPIKSFEKISDLVIAPEKSSNVNSIYNYGNSLNQIQMLNGVCMHDAGYNGSGMTIAVLDAGFANADTHPAFDSLRAHNQILGTKDFTFISPLNLYASTTDGHGTAVLGTMGGNLPGQLVGTAPKANYWLLRSEYGPTEYIIEEYNWAAAAEFADSVGADIINSSLGYNTFNNPAQDHTMSQLNGKTSIASKAATMCARKGMIVCNSAGNSGGTGWPLICFPADADSIITVGGVDAAQSFANFSSTGPTTDGRIKPDVVAQAVGSVIATSNGTIGTASGTSFSSPITAGMVACLWQAAPTKTNMEIIQAIKQSASLYTTPNNQFGYGIPDYCAAKNNLLGINTKNNTTSITLASANPFKNEIKLNILLPDTKIVVIEIVDLLGQIVYKNEISLSAHTQLQYTINTGVLSVGVYSLSVYSTEKSNPIRFITKLVKAD